MRLKTVIVRQVTAGADPDRIWIVPIDPDQLRIVPVDSGIGDTEASRTACRLAYLWAMSEQASRDIGSVADEDEADVCAIIRAVLDFLDPQDFVAEFVLDGHPEVRPAP